MTDDRYTLAEARAIIDAETCVRSDSDDQHCPVHGSRWLPGWSSCTGRPEVTDVAAQLLATVERVRALAYDLSSNAARSDLQENQRRGLRAIAAEVTAAINGEEVTE